MNTVWPEQAERKARVSKSEGGEKMFELDRRAFLKRLGQGTVVLGMGAVGFSGEALAQPAGSSPWKTSDDEWEFYYPNQYDARDAKALAAFQAKLEKIRNWGKVDIQGVVSGRLTSENTPVVSWNPYENNFKVTAENMKQQAAMYVPNVPLFSDPEFAGKALYGGPIAFPLVLTLEVMPAMPKAEGIGDYMVVSAHNDVINFYRPIREGDTLFTVYDEQHCVDITPEAGSRFRTFTMSGSGKTYNQRGELVAEGANILTESFRRRVDPAKRNPGGAHAWESPDWWSRKPYQYTDADWEYVKGIWRNEKYREGILYWDDVMVGEELTPHAYGPMLVEEETDMLYSIPQWASDIKRDMLDPAAFAKMVKNSQGIWVPKKYVEKRPAAGPLQAGGGDPEVLPELSNRDGRGTVQNAVIPKFAAGMLYNWMGEAGWLQRIGWDIMELPPGYPRADIPEIPMALRPALFDKYPYMEKVPRMRGCRAAWHALEGDLIITHAYVADKYSKDGEYFVDLVWWAETLDNYLVEEGFATVKLPKK
jgi:acyl dehydratase